MWLLLHGFTGSPQSWNRVVARAGFDNTPLIPFLSGHGPDWHGRNVESFESEVSRLISLATSAARPRLLCGYSMGARVALGLLARQPCLFDAALLIGAHPGLTDEASRAERREADANRARLLREQGTAAFVTAWEDQPLFASQRHLCAGVLADQRAIRLGHDPEGLARALDVIGLAEMPNYRPALASLEMPITLMAGALDVKFSRIASALAEENAHIDVELVDSVGHNVLLEAPGDVAAALMRVQEMVCR